MIIGLVFRDEASHDRFQTDEMMKELSFKVTGKENGLRWNRASSTTSMGISVSFKFKGMSRLIRKKDDLVFEKLNEIVDKYRVEWVFLYNAVSEYEKNCVVPDLIDEEW